MVNNGELIMRERKVIDKKYGVVIIGGGLSGLSCAAILAENGISPLLLCSLLIMSFSFFIKAVYNFMI